jgi:hypothetical protein
MPHINRGRTVGGVRRHSTSASLVVLAGAFAALVCVVALAAANGRSWISALSHGDGSANTDSGTDPRLADLQNMAVGAIVLHGDDEHCQQMKFDNSTGRTLESFKPCGETVRRNADGVPLPMGTLHRLDAISKSFMGKSQ